MGKTVDLSDAFAGYGADHARELAICLDAAVSCSAAPAWMIDSASLTKALSQVRGDR
jgi:hypothetical protein